MKMTLSIIIPVYNAEQYLQECLNSVFTQSLDSFEVICVDDGSTDYSTEIIRHFKQSHPNLILIQQANRGPASARNTGLRSASGDYVFFLDNDDTFNNSTNLPKALRHSVEENADICVFNALFDGEKPFMESFPESLTSITGPELIKIFYTKCHSLMIPIWGHLYKREFLQRNNFWFNENLLVEDILFTPIVQYCAQKAICIDIPVVNYRWQRPGAITSKETIKHYIDKRNTGRELYQWFNSNHVSEDEPYRMIFSVYIELIHSLSEKKINPHTILDSSDYEIMKQCYRTDYEIRCYHLAKYSPNILMRYQNNTLPPIVRKAINRFL